MLGRVGSFFFAVLLSFFTYIFMLSLSLTSGDPNPVSRISQFFLSILLSSMPFAIVSKDLVKLLKRRKFSILLIDLTLVSFLPFSYVASGPLPALLASALLVAFPSVLNFRLKVRSFSIRLPHLYLLRPRFVIANFDGDGDVRIEDDFYSWGLGFSVGMASRIASAKARNLVRNDKVVLPLLDKRFRNMPLKFFENLEMIRSLSFFADRPVSYVTSANAAYTGYVDAVIERDSSGLSLSVLGCEPLILSDSELILMKSIYRFVASD
ncbi:MAG: hypothetical protein QXV32_04665 [Conexivisphaerales archaeon]